MSISQKDESATLPALPLSNITGPFLIGNTLYQKTNHNPFEIKQIINAVVKGLGLLDIGNNIDHSKDPTTENAGLIHQPGNEGYIAYIRYTHDDGVDALVIISGKMSLTHTAQGKEINNETHYIFAGDINGTQNTITPTLSHCAAWISDTDTVHLLEPLSRKELLATLCYGHTCLRSIVDGQAPDLRKSQYWLECSIIPAAEREFRMICALDTLEKLRTDTTMQKAWQHNNACGLPEPKLQ